MSRLPVTRPSLLLRLRQFDDAAAWSEFLSLYGPAVFGYFRRRGLQEADAVDQTQEVFRCVAGFIGRFDYQPEAGRFRAWLFTVVARQYLKFHQRGDKLPLADDPACLDDVPAADACEEAAWEESVRRQMFDIALEQVRAQVNETTYLAFKFTAIDGLSGEDA
ncbi:RNA polymerase sigma factor, partial [Zavarzinella formosa]|uniref:RNA polymerase sigma factor n=1 Tax=Zavarzinella formosa TaxID=360055 RepID=UPI000496AC44